MKNNLKTFPKFDSFSHPYIAEWKKDFEAELQEILKAVEEDAAWKRHHENEDKASFIRGILGEKEDGEGKEEA